MIRLPNKWLPFAAFILAVTFFSGMYISRERDRKEFAQALNLLVQRSSQAVNSINPLTKSNDGEVRFCRKKIPFLRECLTESEIFGDKGQTLAEDDPLLLEYIRSELIIAPDLETEYNLNPANKKFEQYSKQFEIILKLLNGKRNGVFVEAGANDGDFISNTVMLEKIHGWTGLLVEPDTKAFAALKTKNRKSWIANVCLSPSKRMEKLTFLLQKESTWSKIANVSDHHKSWKQGDTKETTIKCAPFFSLVASLDMLVIDYFSLDIEGAELPVLETIPFDKVLIRTMTIEYDKIITDPGADLKLKSIMSTNGFTLYTNYTNGFAADYIFVHSSVLNYV